MYWSGKYIHDALPKLFKPVGINYYPEKSVPLKAVSKTQVCPDTNMRRVKTSSRKYLTGAPSSLRVVLGQRRNQASRTWKQLRQ
mmetsp:Transcript_8502/g.13374  ORF Transcript_8502/g.13374 Transcript_8502/m.13374 type:complete len:84 (+) Transcript_8502:211-462(+)